jgi:hypothetical protein
MLTFFVYRHYQQSETYFDHLQQHQYASEYFIGQDKVRSHKPFLWIHAQGETNSRDWQSFGSRTSTFLNQPYLYLTMKSTLDKCNESFNVCLIDDSAFQRLIPSWAVDMNTLPSPVKENYRQFAMALLLHHYGGLSVPYSFLCLDDLHTFYKKEVQESNVFAVEVASSGRVAPSPLFMGCNKGSLIMKQVVDQLGFILKSDFTNESHFSGAFERICRDNKVTVVDGALVGVKKACGSPMDLSDLLSQNDLLCIRPVLGIHIDAEEILRRPKFAWFSRMSVEQLKESSLSLMKFIEF